MEEAKTKRTMAKTQFTRVKKGLAKLLANPLSMYKTTERKFGELKVKWQEVQDHQNRYAALASLKEEDQKKEESSGLRSYVTGLRCWREKRIRSCRNQEKRAHSKLL